MKHLFVPDELALLAKEKEFNEPIISFYVLQNGEERTEIENNAPLYQQLVDWFETEHNIHIETPIKCALGYLPHIYKEETCTWQGNYYSTKSEAYNAALTEAFKLI